MYFSSLFSTFDFVCDIFPNIPNRYHVYLIKQQNELFFNHL